MRKPKHRRGGIAASAAMGADMSGATAGRETASATMATRIAKNVEARVMRTMTITNMTTSSRLPVAHADAAHWKNTKIGGV